MALQSSNVDRIVRLTLVSVPVTGVLPSDIVVQYKKNGQPSLSTKTMSGSNWVELGNGLYTITFSVSDTDTLGTFFYSITSVKFDNLVSEELDIEPIPTTVLAANPLTCVVSGAVVDAGAGVPRNLKIMFRTIQFPSVATGKLVSADPVYTFPDAYGNFSVSLLRGAIVLVEIEKTGIRAQITIPDSANANLLDLLPPTLNIFS